MDDTGKGRAPEGPEEDPVNIEDSSGSGATDDPLSEFEGESDLLGKAATGAAGGAAPRAVPTAGKSRSAMFFGILALVQAPFVGLWLLSVTLPPRPSSGTVRINTSPTGAAVRVDGATLGRTPIELPLAAGQRVEYHLDLAPAARTPVAQRGSIDVTTEPAGATVLIDGIARGLSPVSQADLAAGDHKVLVRFSTSQIERTVRVRPGSTSSLIVTPVAGEPAVLSGSVAFNVRTTLLVYERERLLGTTDIARLRLPVGEHALDLVDDQLGFRTRRVVRVAPDGLSTITINLPRTSLTIDAVPWAEVWIGGQRVGETPLDNLMWPIGRYTVTFRHPEFGQRSASVLVGLKEPARVLVNMDQSARVP